MSITFSLSAAKNIVYYKVESKWLMGELYTMDIRDGYQVLKWVYSLSEEIPKKSFGKHGKYTHADT